MNNQTLSAHRACVGGGDDCQLLVTKVGAAAEAECFERQVEARQFSLRTLKAHIEGLKP